MPQHRRILQRVQHGRGAGQHAVKVSSARGRSVESSTKMIEDATTFRSKEKVLGDLSKALQFSPESLEANRKGELSKEQAKKLAVHAAAGFFLSGVDRVHPPAHSRE